MNIQDNLPDNLDLFDEEVDTNESEAEKEVIEEEVETTHNDESLSDLSSFLEQEKKIKEKTPVKKTTPVQDILGSISVDLNNLSIVSKPEFELNANVTNILNDKPSFQVVALQSGYSAHMESLNFNDIGMIRNSSADQYTATRKFYNIVHKRIQDTSVGRIGFNDFLKNTSYHDLETLVYGIYSQTYPEESKFNITCSSCKQVSKLNISNNDLIVVQPDKQDEVMIQIQKVISEVRSIDDLAGKTLVNTKKRVMLNDSKMVVDIYTPSLHDHLSLIEKLTPETLENQNDVVNTMLFVKDVYMIDLAETKNTGKAAFFKLNGYEAILAALTELSISDGEQLQKAIIDFSTKYEIEYKIRNLKCPKCNDSLGEIPIDVETMLFTRMAETKA